MKSAIKFSVINTLFFGFVGSLIGGFVPFLFLGEHLIDRGSFLTVFVTTSLTVGFLPASLTGFYYSKLYKRKYGEDGVVTFGDEIKIAFKTSFLSMFFYTFLFELILLISSYFTGSTSTQLPNVFVDTSAVCGLLIIDGVIAGCICANLLSELNEKMVSELKVIK